MNRLNPEKLALSKWTAVLPIGKRKHFLVSELIRDERDVVASAKSLTTRHDLSEGIGKAVEAVLQASGADVAGIGMASLSTTLATNALVEGQGGRAGLVSGPSTLNTVRTPSAARTGTTAFMAGW